MNKPEASVNAGVTGIIGCSGVAGACMSDSVKLSTTELELLRDKGPGCTGGRRAVRSEAEVCSDVGPVAKRAQPAVSLESVADGMLPLLLCVVDFLGDLTDFVCVCGVASASLAAKCKLATHPHWEVMYHRRWPAFYDSMKYMGAKDWRMVQKLTLSGRCSNLLEVFFRQHHGAFARSAVPAWVFWEASTNSFVAKYLGCATETLERIPEHEAVYRLRFCPAGVCGSLRPGRMPSQQEIKHEELLEDDPECRVATTPYPFRVLKGVDDTLVAGQSVELQWKMREDGPFAWWHGCVEEFHRRDDGRRVIVSIVFDHFPKDSPWHRQVVEIGDGKMRPSAVGGYIGGLRCCSESDQQRWTIVELAAAAERVK